MSAVMIAAFLLHLSVTSSAVPLSCEDLLRPLAEVDCGALDGTWTLLAGSLSHLASHQALRLRDSITMEFSQSCSNISSYTQANRLAGRCHYRHYNVSIDNSRFTFLAGGRFNLSGAFLRAPCSDCAVVRWDVESTRRRSLDVYLLGRGRGRGREEVEEMQEYQAQLECLGLPPPVVMDPTQELCPPEGAGAASVQ